MQAYTVVYIHDGSRHGHRPETFEEELFTTNAVYLGRFPVADPQIPDHMVLVPLEKLSGLCSVLSPYGWDALIRVDSDGEVFLSDDGGRTWYPTNDGDRGAEDPVRERVQYSMNILSIAPQVMGEPAAMLPVGVWQRSDS